MALDRGDKCIYRLLSAIEPIIVHKLLLVVLHDHDLFAAAKVDQLERLEVGVGQVLQEDGTLLGGRCSVPQFEVLHLSTSLAELIGHIQPSATDLLWHSVAPECLENEPFAVFSLVSDLLDGPLIHCVCVPATVDLEAVKTGVKWDGLGDGVEQLVDRFRGAAPEEF